jgi:branched-chain amino acid transport system substrate-binding protein
MAATSLNEDRPVLIGQVASRTGNNPGGHDNIIGAGLAVEEVNARGGVLGGRPLRILVEDDATRPEHAITAYQRLAESGVCAVVGTSFSNASLAVIPHAERARVPYLSTGAAGSQVEPVRRHVFVVTPPSGIVAEQMARFAVWQGWNTVAVASDTDSRFSREGAAAARRWGQALGLRVLDAGTFRTSTTDFGHIFRAAGAAALFAWATGPPSLAIVRYYLARGIEHPLVLSHGAATPDLLGAVAANLRRGVAGAGRVIPAAIRCPRRRRGDAEPPGGATPA